MPALPKLSKKPGPTCIPIMKTNSTRPKSCTKVRMSIGAVKPMCPAKIPMNRTKVTPNEMPPTFTFPNKTPMAMTIEYSSTMCATDCVFVKISIIQSITYSVC